MNHDPLCPRSHQITFTVWRSACECALIRRVRADESQHADQWGRKIRANALRDAVEAVLALPDAIFQQAAWVKHEQAVAAIEALGGER